MAVKWTKSQERVNRLELRRLYVHENKTIGEIADILNVGQTTVYDRLIRLNVPIDRSKKQKHNNRRSDIVLPNRYSDTLAEFIGILLGDGHLTPTQVTVTLGTKDEYVDFVKDMVSKLFRIQSKYMTAPQNAHIVYFGSTVAVKWLLSMGMVFNKVKQQVDVPSWIFSKKNYMRAAVRGLMDTDGSVYLLRSGVQMSFTNCSKPLLESFRRMLMQLNFCPSKISGHRVYLTKQGDLRRYFQTIGFHNQKHTKRFLQFSG